VSSLYDATHGFMLKVMGDNISAYDVVIGQIDGKGKEINRISNFWKKKLSGIIKNDIVITNHDAIARLLGFQKVSEDLQGKMSLVRVAEVVPIEAIVRGYISGSLYEEYEKNNGKRCHINGLWIPAGMKESQMFPVPIFTPTTKESVGHDKPIDYERMVLIISGWIRERGITGHTGRSLAQTIRTTSIALYSAAYNIAIQKGIIIADTKFEFGMIYTCEDGCKLILIDEVLTPDSSRFWPFESYKVGESQPSLDKQFFRDWLIKEAQWDKVSSPSEIPESVKAETIKRYRKISKILTS
jgi:phosphoribosylaminoimidazole-succinocarboxamide synthase